MYADDLPNSQENGPNLFDPSGKLDLCLRCKHLVLKVYLHSQIPSFARNTQNPLEFLPWWEQARWNIVSATAGRVVALVGLSRRMSITIFVSVLKTGQWVGQCLEKNPPTIGNCSVWDVIEGVVVMGKGLGQAKRNTLQAYTSVLAFLSLATLSPMRKRLDEKQLMVKIRWQCTRITKSLQLICLYLFRWVEVKGSPGFRVQANVFCKTESQDKKESTFVPVH